MGEPRLLLATTDTGHDRSNQWTLAGMKTLRAARLGAELRQLRERARLKPEKVCDQLGWKSTRTLHRIETGETVIKQNALAAALDLYGADSATRGALEALRKEAQAKRRGWWMGYGDVFRSPLPAIEHEARRIRAFESMLVPGLLQTPEYARALMTVGLPSETPEQIDRRVHARMNRQHLLTRHNPPELHAILDESVLARRVGGTEVMRQQYSALWQASRRPHVTLQVLPFDAGAHVGMDGPFMIINCDEDTYPEVAYTEGPGGDVYLEGDVDLDRLSLRWDRLAVAALSPEDSARRFAELADEE